MQAHFKMKHFVILIQIFAINCTFLSTRINAKSNPTTFENETRFNYQDSVKLDKCGGNTKRNLDFANKTYSLADESGRFGDFFGNCTNVECIGNETSSNIKRHILSGLLVHHDLPHSHWLEYKSVYNKLYETQRQELAALSQWRRNLRRVAEHNRLFLAGKQSYSLHLNQFGDWNRKDYFKKILKLFDTRPLFDPAEDPHSTTLQLQAHRKVPLQVDWRAKGFKPKLEEQWQCGACYAFAVSHALQAQLFKKHGDWKELSPQQIVDCSASDGNMGCDGGSLRAAMRYSARRGLISEDKYPYIGKRGRCKDGSSHHHTRPRSWAMLPSGDEDAMEKALATIGPLAVALNAAPFTFQLYRSGIYDDPFCVPWRLNHAMLLVGYTPHYWVLLNWWGRNWGENGYIRVRRGRHRCGISRMAAYVEL